jgi:hypothetical protein
MCVQVTKTANRFEISSSLKKILLKQVRGYVKCHVYFSTFVFANESWIFFCRVLSFIFYWFGMVRRKLTIPERWQAVGPPSAKLPWSAPAVLNGRCRASLDMSRSSLGVVLRGLSARGRSVAFPVWRKRCISRTMMEWLTLKWSECDDP